MRTDLFDFDLPDDRIALRPADPRDIARLLVVDPHEKSRARDLGVRDLPDLLSPKDVLVLNDTKVIPAALEGTRQRGDARATISLNLVKPHNTDGRWQAFARPAKRLAVGDKIRFGEVNLEGAMRAFSAIVIAKEENGSVGLEFSVSGERLDQALSALGRMPLPPYIAGRRSADMDDTVSYQTIFAKRSGAVAAPTAGLHFTPELFERLNDKGVKYYAVTLHVGAGTFLPVKTDSTKEHEMHAEWGEIQKSTAEALNNARAAGGRIIAVGTTCLRLLESAARDDRTIEPFVGSTDIFITPGYRFKAVDLLMTNFHLPRSTLFMLVSAFSGLDTMKAAYAHAINNKYRFYSYGDACLLFPQAPTSAT